MGNRSSSNQDPDNAIDIDYWPLFRVYKSGRIKRYFTANTVPASFDPATGVTSKDVTIDPDTNVKARLYLPNLTDTPQNKKLPILVYYHGGAFVFESAFAANYHKYLNSIVSQARVVAVSVDYRLAPEHRLPAAYDDSWAALKWVFSPNADEWLREHGDLDRVFIAGDSSGGNICHQVAMRAGDDEVKIEGMILAHPYFWGAEPIWTESRDPAKRALVENAWRAVNETGVGVDHPTLNPMAEGAPGLAGLGCRKVMVWVAMKDYLKERGRVYVEKLKESGWDGEVDLIATEDKDHVFHLQKPSCKEAKELMERAIAFINRE